MTMQIPDKIEFKNEIWNILEISDEKGILDIKKLNFYPKSNSTACYRGFTVDLRLNRKKLILNRINVYGMIDNSLKIYGVELKDNKYEINQGINYTGSLLIGKNYFGGNYAFICSSPEFYEMSYILYFENGRLIKDSVLYDNNTKQV